MQMSDLIAVVASPKAFSRRLQFRSVNNIGLPAIPDMCPSKEKDERHDDHEPQPTFEDAVADGFCSGLELRQATFGGDLLPMAGGSRKQKGAKFGERLGAGCRVGSCGVTEEVVEEVFVAFSAKVVKSHAD